MLVIVGESPRLATVKEAPFESYVGFPDALKESTEPLVKSTLIALPNAGSGWQPGPKSVHSRVQLEELTYFLVRDYSPCRSARHWVLSTAMPTLLLTQLLL